MKGIYLTEEGKQEIEAKIAELELNEKIHEKNGFIMGANMNHGFVDALKEMLSSATILPVEESWEETCCELPFYIKQQLENNFSTGVIIQPKQD
jgi:hypothetical protein